MEYILPFFFHFIFGFVSVKSFDPVQYFDTTEELIDRTFNRPRLSVLKKEFVNVKSRCEVEVNTFGV